MGPPVVVWSLIDINTIYRCVFQRGNTAVPGSNRAFSP
jgi:hypothetical protein